jgi:alkaline phosphatase
MAQGGRRKADKGATARLAVEKISFDGWDALAPATLSHARHLTPANLCTRIVSCLEASVNYCKHLAASVAMAVLLTPAASAEPVFNRIASFPVNTNLAADEDQKTETSAEIITASPDGMTLIYSDSPAKRIGFIDIADPANPKPAGILKLDGEPTSVSMAGKTVLAGVNTSKSFSEPSGSLLSINLADRSIAATCDVGGQPDSVAVSPDGTIAAVAVENERDEDLNEGALPQMPAGHVAIFKLKDGVADCASLVKANVTGLAAGAGDDPEPEFVDINANNEIAVTLQENNHIVILKGDDGSVLSHFSAGTVDMSGIDTKSDGKLSFTDKFEARPREPDAIQWIGNDRVLIANEGDYKGGTRGFTIFSKMGEVLHESGPDLEFRIIMVGQYPDKRSRAKGIEPEGAEVAEFDGARYLFVLSERSSMAAVYKDTGAAPEFLQLLPSGLSPEGVIAIPSRKLLAVANEVDLIEDGGVRSHVTLYGLAEGTPAYPTIVSEKDANGLPIGWGALSGLAAVPGEPGFLNAISDSFYSAQPRIYTIDATQKPARIVSALDIMRNGAPAQLLDLEGIAPDGEGGFWLANEGRFDTMVPHGILHVNDKGEIDQAVGLPDDLARQTTRFGFEGIAVDGSGDSTRLWMAVQREWADDPKGTVKLVSYNPKDKEWGAVRYPLDAAPEGGWVGLSEITFQGDHAYVIERDNQIGAAASIKKIYRIAKTDLAPAKLDGELPVVKKELVRDLLPDLKSTGGYVLDKVEGFAFDAAGEAFIVTDNDGVDNSNGETMFWSIGKLQTPG